MTATLQSTARQEADALVGRNSDTPLTDLVRAVESQPPGHFRIAGLAAAVAAELRRRDALGIRVWPAPRLVFVHPDPSRIQVAAYRMTGIGGWLV